jgi:hypothetical protein
MKSYKNVYFICLFILITLILFCRNPNTFLYPVLHAEDGRDIFHYYYAERNPVSILRYYNGYVSFLPNLIAYTVMAFPIVYVPKLLSLVPLVLAGFAYSLFYCPRFRTIISRDTTRLAFCLTIAAVPIGNFPLISSTIYIYWNFFLILVLLSLVPLPAKPLAGLLQFLAMSAMICSHPSSVVLIPMCLFALYRRQSRTFYIGLIVVVMAYLVIGVSHQHLGIQPLKHAYISVRLLLERVIFEVVFGNTTRLFMYRRGMHYVMCAVASILPMAGIYAVYRLNKERPFPKRYPVLFCYLIVSLTVTTSIRWHVLVMMYGRHVDVLSTYWGHRYFYIQKFFFILLMFYCISIAMDAARLRKRYLVIGVLCCIVYIAALNTLDNSAYRPSLERGREVKNFIEDIARQEKIHGNRQEVRAKLDRGAWSIVLD